MRYELINQSMHAVFRPNGLQRTDWLETTYIAHYLRAAPRRAVPPQIDQSGGLSRRSEGRGGSAKECTDRVMLCDGGMDQVDR